MFTFQRDKPTHEPDRVPFFEDATTENGWQGHTTGKTLETLKTDVRMLISRLGGEVTDIEKGRFGDRIGYRVSYIVDVAFEDRAKHVPGYIDIAALPLKPPKTYDRRHRTPISILEDRSLRMALFNVVECLRAMWILQRLSPGFAPLMPFMIAQDGMNVTQLWSNSPTMKALVAPQEGFQDGDGEVVDGEVAEVRE